MAVEKITYGGWPNCYRLENGVVDLVVTGDVGPRIIRWGFIGQENEFVEVKETLGKTGGSEWRIYGGHRLWHAPEQPPRTYYPDNGPVRIEMQGETMRVFQPVEPTTGIEKQIDITLATGAAHARVVHRLVNRNLWAVELAPWALSVMAPGGTCVIPFPERGSHTENLLPGNTLTLWTYTNMADPRWTWDEKYIFLRQEEGNTIPQKVGVMTPDGWVAYARGGHLFLKTFPYIVGATYPDGGASVETFTNEFMLEAETLGPLVSIAPGAFVEHVETWYLFQGVPVPQNADDVETHILPKVRGV